MTLPRPRSRAAVAALVLLVAPAVAGCSSDEAPAPGEPDATPTARPTVGGTELLGRWPLTGLPAKGKAPARPVVVVKIDNTSSSSPQVGLSRADLVVEEMVEGGVTRLAAMFYTRIPPVAGPVRSLRATDIGVVTPVDGVVVTSGGAPVTNRRIAKAGVKTFTEGSAGFYRESGRSAPYDLMMRLPTLIKAMKVKPKVPPAYLPWGEDIPRGARAREFTATFSPAWGTSWTYRGKSKDYLNNNSYAGDDFRPDTVLVLRVDVGDAGYTDPAGNPVPETTFAGGGEAMLFHAGRMVKGTWSKKKLGSPLELRSGGQPLTVPGGYTWIELVPKQGGSVSVAR